jgi:hypothetical protein
MFAHCGKGITADGKCLGPAPLERECHITINQGPGVLTKVNPSDCAVFVVQGIARVKL